MIYRIAGIDNWYLCKVMKWKFNSRTGTLEPERQTGFRVSGRMGGIMVEDFDRHIQFLIHYGSDEVSHCVGCTARCLNLFDVNTARRIADEIGRVARSHNTRTKYSDFRYLARGMKVDECEGNPNPPVSGMGDIEFPSDGRPGSGDMLERPRRRRRRRLPTAIQPKQKTILSFDDFVRENDYK